MSHASESAPFTIGQRVRCNVRTTTHRQAIYHTVELYGRAGRVVAVTWHPPAPGFPGYWVVMVDYDLGQSFGLWHHRSTELVVAEDWWR